MEESRSGSLRQAAAAAFPLTIPVFTGFLVLGMAYGVLMQTNGYGAFWSTLMSAVAFCGSMQFAAITLLTSAFDPVAALLLSIMVNAWHLFYGISMLGKYKGLGRKRFFLIFGLCDETFSIASTAQPPEGVDRGSFYFFVTLFDYLYWVGGTLLGGLLGSVIPFSTEGLDFALTALFVVLFLGQLENAGSRIYGLIGTVCSLAVLLLVGADNMVIPSMIVILIVLLIGRKRI